jgi:hypothetical protein
LLTLSSATLLPKVKDQALNSPGPCVELRNPLREAGENKPDAKR